jgi:UDP-2-acetamido-2-deoxy-ribo-hexuluronate aminotransferase
VLQFIDLKQQYELYKGEIRREMDAVLDSCRYILGPAVSELEQALADYTGVPHAIACSSGTDAILLALMALELKPGDEVIIPDFTFFATAEMISLIGGVPVIADILPDTYNLDPRKVEEKINKKTRGIIAVSLYGQCPDFDDLAEIASKHGLFLLEDAAQSFGAMYKGRKSCSLTEIATTSFYPAKPLGAYGDGGAVFTQDTDLDQKIRFLLNHGQEAGYQHRYIGINGRLDSLQAAVLKVKLRHFDEELTRRQQVAEWYDEHIGDTVSRPFIREENRSSWAQYTVRHRDRVRIIDHLQSKGIPTAIHYPKPIHQQTAYAALDLSDADYANSVAASREVFSIPMHPFLTRNETQMIASAIKEVLG